MKEINTPDEFMDMAADHDVSFKLEADGAGVRYSVSWPHTMPSEVQAQMQKWVDANKEILAAVLMDMADEIRSGLTGTTIITPERSGTLH